MIMRGFVLLLLFVSSVASAQLSSQKLGEATTPQNAGASVAVSPRNNKNIVVYVGGKLMYSNDLGTSWKDVERTNRCCTVAWKGPVQSRCRHTSQERRTDGYMDGSRCASE